MTRDELAALGVDGAAAEAVLGALAAAEDAARAAERESERLRGDIRRRDQLEQVRDALVSQGAKPGSADLLSLAVDLSRLEEGGDPAALAAPLRQRYPALFEPELPAVHPPGGASLSPGALSAMSEEEINRDWDSVRALLRGGERGEP